MEVEILGFGNEPAEVLDNMWGYLGSLCTLLDKIELASDDEDAVRQLCHQRFEIARNHGFTVEFENETSGATH